MKANLKLDGISVLLMSGAGTVLSTKPLGDVGSLIAAGALALLAWLAGRLTPHTPTPKVAP